MSEREFWTMTLRQVQRHMRGHRIRMEYEQAARISLAWHIQSMAPERTHRGRMPDLKRMIAGQKQGTGPARQTPDQQRAELDRIASVLAGQFVRYSGPPLQRRRLDS